MDKNFHISGRVKNSIQKAVDKGIKVVLATGRMYVAAKPIAESLNLDTPIISYQGALVKDDNREYIHHKIDKDLAYKLISELKEYDVQINVYLEEELLVEEARPYLKKYAQDRDLSYIQIDSYTQISDFSPTKLLVIDEDKKEINIIRDDFRQRYSDSLYVAKSMPIYCEFVNKKAGKGKAILYLAERWGIKQSEIMVVGDQENDKEMLEIAGFAVAMGNAVQSLKQIADYVTDSVENDGVAKAIEELVL